MYLLRNHFLDSLDVADLSLLRNHLPLREVRSGDVLQRAGETVKEVVFPHSAVAVMRAEDTGIALIGSEGFLGVMAVPASAQATCDWEILIGGKASFMLASVFRDALSRSPTLRHSVSQFGYALMAKAQQTAVCNATHAVKERICRWLLDLQDRSPGDRIALTQDTLAKLLGVRRTTINLVLGQLEALGVLRCRRASMQIVDRAAIEKLCCECYSDQNARGVDFQVPEGLVIVAANQGTLKPK
jgi:CRP-like cAMP-binding protein